MCTSDSCRRFMVPSANGRQACKHPPVLPYSKLTACEDFRQHDAMVIYAKEALHKLNQLVEPDISESMTETLQDLVYAWSPTDGRPFTIADKPKADDKILRLSDCARACLGVLSSHAGERTPRMVIAALEAVIISLRDALRRHGKVEVRDEMIFCYLVSEPLDAFHSTDHGLTCP